jgi:hypothetical protein
MLNRNPALHLYHYPTTKQAFADDWKNAKEKYLQSIAKIQLEQK